VNLFLCLTKFYAIEGVYRGMEI